MAAIATLEEQLPPLDDNEEEAEEAEEEAMARPCSTTPSRPR